MSTAHRALLVTGPALAATTLRPVRRPALFPSRAWPERAALACYAGLLAASLSLGGAAEPTVYIGLALVIFLAGAMLSAFSTRPTQNASALHRASLILAAATAAFPFLQFAGSYVGLGLPASAAPRESLLAGLRLASYVALFAGLRFCLSDTHLARRATAILFAGLVGMATTALWRYDPTLSPLGHAGLTGPLINRSAFAVLMGIGMCIGLAFASQPPHPRAHRPVFLLYRATFCLGTALLFVALVQSQSRLGLISAVTASGVIAALRAPRRAVMLAIAAAIVLAMAWITEGAELAARFSSLPKDLATRSALYAQVWQMILSAPLSGQGAGAFASAFEQVQRPPVSPAFVWDKAHSTILGLWAEMGLVFGSLLPLAALLSAISLARRFRRFGEAQALAALAALALASVSALGDFSLEFPAIAYFMITLIACGIGPMAQARKDAYP